MVFTTRTDYFYQKERIRFPVIIGALYNDYLATALIAENEADCTLAVERGFANRVTSVVVSSLYEAPEPRPEQKPKMKWFFRDGNWIAVLGIIFFLALAVVIQTYGR